MNCRALKKSIPLFAGGELPPAKTEKIRRHLADCPDCRAEAEEIERARAVVREMAGAGAAGDWSPAEWRGMIREIIKTPGERRARTAGMKLRPAFAASLGVLAVAGLFLLQKELRRPAAPETGSFAVVTENAQPVLPPPAPTKNPDVTSVKIRAPETGANIIWFYNKKFEWQGFGK